MSKISGSTGRKASTMGADKKFEGYSNLKGAHEQQQKRIQKSAQNEMTKGLEEEYILNLQKQIVLMEHEIKFLKEREVDQKNKASGYETLLRDGIPLNEHFLALKNKFNNEKDVLEKNVEMMQEEINKEMNSNKQRNHKIEILKREYEEISTAFTNDKADKTKKLNHSQQLLYTATHTKDILTLEKQLLNDQVNNLKNENQNMGRSITKDQYHNKRDEIEKKRRKDLDQLQEDINTTTAKIEQEQTALEEEIERNEDP